LHYYENTYSAVFKLLYIVTLTCCTPLFSLIPSWGKGTTEVDRIASYNKGHHACG